MILCLCVTEKLVVGFLKKYDDVDMRYDINLKHLLSVITNRDLRT